MIGDDLIYYEEYQGVTNFVMSQLRDKLKSNSRICISVGGESGCGKTSLAYALSKDIESHLGLKGFLFHLDDYFKLPPADNHNKRLKDISNVGMDEVNLELLDSHINEFKQGTKNLVKPLVDYSKNKILKEEVNSFEYDFCIVEGTFVSFLKSPDYKIFVDTTYIDTLNSRIERARDILDDFNEKVLEIEHQIIKKHRSLADLIIDKNLKMTNPKQYNNVKKT